MRAIGTADGNAEVIRLGIGRLHRMVQPFKSIRIHIIIRAERAFVQHAFGTLIDHGPFIARERHGVFFVLEEILPHFRAYFFEQKAHMRGNRIIAQNGMMGLEIIMQTQSRKTAADNQKNEKC